MTSQLKHQPKPDAFVPGALNIIHRYLKIIYPPLKHKAVASSGYAHIYVLVKHRTEICTAWCTHYHLPNKDESTRTTTTSWKPSQLSFKRCCFFRRTVTFGVDELRSWNECRYISIQPGKNTYLPATLCSRIPKHDTCTRPNAHNKQAGNPRKTLVGSSVSARQQEMK